MRGTKNPVVHIFRSHKNVVVRPLKSLVSFLTHGFLTLAGRILHEKAQERSYRPMNMGNIFYFCSPNW